MLTVAYLRHSYTVMVSPLWIQWCVALFSLSVILTFGLQHQSSPAPAPTRKLYKCCGFMRKSMLPPGFPTDEETETYLRKEFSWIPSDVPLTLRTYLASRRAGSREGNARALSIFAIWSSERRALTTKGIRLALINADPYYSQNADAAQIQAPGGKRKKWAVSLGLPPFC